MTEKHVLKLIAASLETLRGLGMLASDVKLNSQTILLGIESPLDSIGFVAFITDLEERISSEAKKDLYLVLNEMSEFNVNKPYLSSDALAKYIVKISEGE